MDGFLLGEQVSIVVKERDDTRVSPEIDGHILKTGQVGPVFSHAGTLRMTDTHVLQNISTFVKEQETFIAATGIDLGFGFGVVTKISHGDTIGVVLEFAVPA